MPTKLTFSLLRRARQSLTGTLLLYPRWWEVGVISAGLVLGMMALYWWLWRPVPVEIMPAANQPVQLEVPLINQLTRWAAEREQQYQRATIEPRFGALFK